MCCPAKTNTSTTTSSTTVPEWLSNAGQDIYNRSKTVADRPFQPYNGDTVAGLSGLQIEGMDQAGRTRDAYMNSNRMGTADAYFRAFGETPANQINGQQYFDNRSTIDPNQFGRTAGYDANQFRTPTQVQGNFSTPQTINPSQFSQASQITGDFGQRGSVNAQAQLGGQRLDSSAYGPTQGINTDWLSNRSTIDTSQFSGPLNEVQAGQVGLNRSTSGMLDARDADPFRGALERMNPFLEGVLQPTLRNIREQGAIARNAIGAQAIGSSAFGDARHGIMTANQFDDEQTAVADNVRTLMAQGYDRATAERQADINRYTGAYTGDIDRQVGVDTNNVNRTMSADMFNVQQELARRGQGLQAQQADAALREAALGRNFGAQQFNANLGEAATQRRLAADTANMSAGEQALARMLQAETTNANLAETAQNRLLQQATQNANLSDQARQRLLSALQFDANLGEAATNRGFQQATQNANLADTAMQRYMAGLQYNAGLDEAAMNRQLTATQADANLREAGLSRQFGAEQENARLSEAALQRLLTGGQQLAGLDSTAIQQGTALTNLLQQQGALEQSQQQKILTDAYNRFLENRDYPQAQLDVLLRAISGQPKQSTTTQIAQTPAPQNNAGLSLLGGIAGALL